MKPGFVFPIVLAIALSSPIDLLAGPGQTKTAQKKEYPSCRPGELEIENPNPGKHRPVRLPPELMNVKVQRSVLLLKLCVSETGDVARVLVLESSGNTNVDTHYATAVSKWTFAPAERDKKRVRSVVPVAITLHIK